MEMSINHVALLISKEPFLESCFLNTRGTSEKEDFHLL